MLREDACDRFEAQITAYHQDELPPERRAEVERHLAACSACAAALAEVRSVFTLAGEIEELVPSMRFKRSVAALVSRAKEPEEEGVLARIGLAIAFLGHRLRTSGRFRLATVSVGIHIALLLLISFVLIPRVTEDSDRDVKTRWVREVPAGAMPVLPDLAKSQPPAPLPPDVDAAAPEVADSRPFRSEPPNVDIGPLQPYLPRIDQPVVQRLAGLFATALDTSLKERRMAACMSDPEGALKAVGAGLGYLAKSQEKDGAWPVPERNREYRTGVTAVALLAFLSDGHSETRGLAAYRAVVTRAVDRLLADQQQDGAQAGRFGPARGHFAYNQALATMALSECYVLDVRRAPAERAARLRRAVRLGLGFIEREQTESGAWPYGGDPNPTQADTSVAIFMGLAVTAGRSAGFRVQDRTFERLSGWLRKVTDRNGLVGYRSLGDRLEGPRTRTAGVLYLEEILGLAAPIRDRQAKLVREDIEDGNRTKENGLLRFYSALAFRVRGTPVLDLFAPAMLAAQRPNGSWSASGDEWAVYGGDSFLTALNVLTLTSSFRFPG